ncbi:twin-arginine translocation signal domain-containing protein [Haloferax namakaokahaiae]|uniref:Twin-arginine translocation signal domain-containing protein n=1 Tax=Haloferax namakaokahaiae TaxID=1748331 RepID=A0ABD5ZJ76_9EURY
MTTRPLLRLSRRSLMKKSALATLALGVGVPAFSGTAAATSCPRTPGYWMNHDWPDGGLAKVNQKLGTDFQSVEEGQAFLKMPTRGDKGVIMATHLIATILNFQGRDGSEPTCVDAYLADYDTTVREAKQNAESWLADSSFPAAQRRWRVAGVDGEELKDVLDAFNNNALGLDCGCGTLE